MFQRCWLRRCISFPGAHLVCGVAEQARRCAAAWQVVEYHREEELSWVQHLILESSHLLPERFYELHPQFPLRQSRTTIYLPVVRWRESATLCEWLLPRSLVLVQGYKKFQRDESAQEQREGEHH